MSEMEIKTKGYSVIEKPVKASGNGAVVYVPKKWVGKLTKIILIEK